MIKVIVFSSGDTRLTSNLSSFVFIILQVNDIKVCRKDLSQKYWGSNPVNDKGVELKVELDDVCF